MAKVAPTTSSTRNLISGNSGDGVEIVSSATTGNVIAGNYIGTDAAGEVQTSAMAATASRSSSGADNNWIGVNSVSGPAKH